MKVTSKKFFFFFLIKKSKIVHGIEITSKYVISTCEDGFIKIWDIKNGICLDICSGFYAESSICAFQPNFLIVCGFHQFVQRFEFNKIPYCQIDSKENEIFENLIFKFNEQE